MGNLCNFNCNPCSRSLDTAEVDEQRKVECKGSFEEVVQGLVKKSERINVKGGVSRKVFTSCVYSRYPEFSNHVFDFLTGSYYPMKTDFITTDHLFMQIHKLVAHSSHAEQCHRYLAMYATKNGLLDSECFKEFIKLIYDISMDLHPDGPLVCPEGDNTIQLIVESVFHNKTVCSIGFLEPWIELNCPCLVAILQNYVVSGLKYVETEITHTDENETKPLLHKTSSGELSTSHLPVSRVWLLSTLLPSIYTRPYDVSKYNTVSNTSRNSQVIHSINFEIIPTHWKLLYESSFHGCSANRFYYHVLGYQAPTVTFLTCGEDRLFCICISNEWVESQHYWGDKYCFLVQILPRFYLADKGGRLVYMNFSVHQSLYPSGIRVGSDHSKPTLTIDDSIAQVTYQGKTFVLHNLAVWGCGSKEAFEELLLNKKKKNGINEANISATSTHVLNHPDRYLLSLASGISQSTMTDF